jgi:hypothetical protein
VKYVRIIAFIGLVVITVLLWCNTLNLFIAGDDNLTMGFYAVIAAFLTGSIVIVVVSEFTA